MKYLFVDLALTVGNVSETVQVKETAPLLQSQTATVSSLVSNQQIVEMPLNGRTFTALLKLSPGAATGTSSNLTTSPYAMRGDVNISVNGSSAQNNSYLIDGMVNRNLWLSTLIMVPTVDAIQEVRMLNSNYSAEYVNAFNRANFTVPNSNVGNPLAGIISSTAPARIMQMALKVSF